MSEAIVLLTLIANASVAIQSAASLIQKAMNEGREITPEERKQIEVEFEASFLNLRQAIQEKEGKDLPDV